MSNKHLTASSNVYIPPRERQLGLAGEKASRVILDRPVQRPIVVQDRRGVGFFTSLPRHSRMQPTNEVASPMFISTHPSGNSAKVHTTPTLHEDLSGSVSRTSSGVGGVCSWFRITHGARALSPLR